MEQPLVVVVGSINLDTTLDVERLPSAGETVLATGVRTIWVVPPPHAATAMERIATSAIRRIAGATLATRRAPGAIRPSRARGRVDLGPPARGPPALLAPLR